MTNKLQELTDRLYNEGLSKGKSEGEKMLQFAKQESEKMIADAKKEAEQILAQANREAEELKMKVSADVKMAANQSVAVTKQKIENLMVTKIAADNVNATMQSPEFVKEILKTVVAAFTPQDAAPKSLDVILPESLKSQLEPFIMNELQKQCKDSLNVTFDKKMGGGFKISPKEEGYMLQFTDEEFRNLISSYLRPATKKILFGE